MQEVTLTEADAAVILAGIQLVQKACLRMLPALVVPRLPYTLSMGGSTGSLSASVRALQGNRTRTFSYGSRRWR